MKISGPIEAFYLKIKMGKEKKFPLMKISGPIEAKDRKGVKPPSSYFH